MDGNQVNDLDPITFFLTLDKWFKKKTELEPAYGFFETSRWLTSLPDYPDDEHATTEWS